MEPTHTPHDDKIYIIHILADAESTTRAFCSGSSPHSYLSPTANITISAKDYTEIGSPISKITSAGNMASFKTSLV